MVYTADNAIADFEEHLHDWPPPVGRVEALELRKHYGGTTALDGVSLTFRGGELCALIGSNGAGKSTFVDALFATARADGGSVGVDGLDITRWSSARRACRGLVRSFQRVRLAGQLTVWENVALGLLAGDAALPGWGGPLAQVKGLHEPVVRALAWVGVAELADARVAELSFGQRKRVSLAQCLAARPRFLALDEPVADLDPGATRVVAKLLAALAAKGIGVLIVEHNLSFAFDTCDRVVVMVSGQITLDGPAAEVRADPRAVEAQLR